MIRAVVLIAAVAALLTFVHAVPAHAADGYDDSVPGMIKLTNYKSSDPIAVSQDTVIILEGINVLTTKNTFSIYGTDCNITIKGSGSLEYSAVILCHKLTVEDCTLTRRNENLTLPAIDASAIEISGATVNIDCDYPTALGKNGTSFSEYIDIKNKAKVTLNAPCGLLAEQLIIDNAELISTSTGVHADMYMGAVIPCGFMATEATIKNNSKVTVSGYAVGTIALERISVEHSYLKADAVVYNIEQASMFLPSAIATFNPLDSEGSVPGVISLNDSAVLEPAGYNVDTYVFGENGETFDCTVIGKNGTPAAHVVIDANHKWDAGKITKPATATADGVKTYTCTVCDETKTEAIPKTGGSDGTAFGPGADAAAAEAAILALPNDKDPKGTTFGILQLKASKTTNSSIKLTWKKTSGAKKYTIYANACGKGKKYQKLTTVTGKSYTVKKVAGKKLVKGKYYKFLMVAVDANNKVVSTSKTVHAATAGGKVGNPTKITTKAKKNKVTVKAKKTFKLAAKQAGKKLKKHRAVSYETSNAKVATVSKKGVIKGVKKGKCKIYAYAQNGVCAVIKVTVK